MENPTFLPERSEVDVQYTWDIASIFPTDESWEAACGEVEAQLPGIARFEGRLDGGAGVLASWFEAAESVVRLVGKVSVYAFLSYAVDTRNQDAVAMTGRANTLRSRVKATLAFAEPEILSIGGERLEKWMEQEPRLADYDHYFERLEERRDHVRSGEVEALLAALSDPFQAPSTTYTALVNADLQFDPAADSEGNELELAQGSIDALLAHPDRVARRTAWEGYADGYLAFQNSLANCLYGAVKQDVFNARARGYESSLAASLAPNRISEKVFHNLIEVFRDNLPTWHRYWRIRRELLGYDTLHVYDIKAPLRDDRPQVPFQRAVDWIVEGMGPLGDEYVTALREGVLQARWVDVYPNKGKRTGAFSSGVQGTHPFILMSYNDTVFSLSTLAHELGHSMHSYFTWKTQPHIYSGYSLFVAEVASNFNQAMVRAHLFETQHDPAFQIALIEEAMSNFHRYFFIMPTLARFELEVHQRVARGESLTAQGMNALMDELFAEGYGGEVDRDRDRIGITWAQFGHLYSSFYVYQYATGISAAHVLSQDVLSGVWGAADRYLGFLRAGSSDYPMDVLKRAGVDLASPEPVERTFDVLAGLVDRLESLMIEG
jgi:oligoendopeptidase F